MTCHDYALLLEKYLEGVLTPAEEAQLRQHEDICPACAAQRCTLDGLQDDLASLKEDVPPIPEGFHQAWTTRVEEAAMENKPVSLRPRRPWTRLLSAAAAVVFVLGGTLLTRDALSPRSAAPKASSTLYTAYDDDSGYIDNATVMMTRSAAYGVEESADYAANGAVGAAYGAAEAVQEQKIIRTVSMTIGTQGYEQSMASLRQQCEDMGGWVSYSSESVGSSGMRRAYLTLRIPSQQLDSYLTDTASLGRIISREESANDVTESYYDTQARLQTQQALMTRLQALVTDAADLSDLLALESQIADTQYQIDALQSSLNSTDRQVTYATVNVTLREETASSDLTDDEKSLGQRLVSALTTGAEAFLSFLSDMAVFLAAALPFILMVAVVGFTVKLIRRGIRRRK
ncbi:MAG: DUF4349 domain-containing protein [Aristaeellaceae bacterium]